MTLPQEELYADPYLELLAKAYQSQHEATIRILKADRGPEAIRELMEDAIARANRYADEALQIEPPTQPLACRKGCSHCCFATVGVVAPEVIYLAEELRARLPTEELAALTERSARLSQRLQQLERGPKLDARVPCALLRDGSCSAYESRTLTCRWACSPSLQSCLDLLVHRTKKMLEMEDVRYQPTQEVWRGLRAGLREAGLDGTLLALNIGLATALAEPDAAQRYLAGEPVFEEAYLD